ncbi:LysR family transcriptional regulator [Amycolatopsis sp. Poz14]|uniref:LysR family transcriptional regulator n=1 Tax=Amycolatopsis sp. Poz14 TaxID=1447705 RepID=UPI001EE7C65E|nr:LysR family transcriptional regulator [Amycolatopsis sp. Poz14]MCG3755278.1 LysR family transcriptional regulator [Amycolatopsis sp. Poz14]
MERRQLEYFVAIAEHGGFTHAARALRVAQPSLSRAIAKLEQDLGVELFHRVGRNAVLSNAGELLAERARLVLRDLDALRAAARMAGDGPAGRIDVAATSSSALEPVISIVAEMRTRYPGVLVSTSAALSAAEVVAMVVQGRCEAGVCGSAERPVGPGLIAHHLRDEELLLVAPPGTEIGSDGAVERAELSGMQFVVTTSPTAVRGFFDRLAATVPDLSIAAEVGDRSVVLPMVLRGIGASLMPDGWAELARRAGAEVLRFSPPETLPQWLIYRSGPITAATQAFLDIATGGTASIGASCPERP